MANRYGISKQDEQEIRARDKRCVYCRVLMKQHPHALCASGATIEHFNNNGPFDRNTTWPFAVADATPVKES
jgi:hypothetical protein